MRGWILAGVLGLGGCAPEATTPETAGLEFVAQPVGLAVLKSSVVVGDVDADGRSELVSVGGASLFVRPWHEEGMFEATVYPLPGAASGLAIADLDGDGVRDVATLLPSRRSLAWLPGTADGPAQAREVVVDAGVQGLVAGDVDGDGTADVVVAADGELVLLRGGPRGPEVVQRLASGEIGRIEVGDLDGDGRGEVVAAVQGRGIQLWTASDAGLLVEGDTIWRTLLPFWVELADLDEDGELDVAATDSLLRVLFVGFGDGAGGWPRREVWPTEVEPASVIARRGPQGMDLVIGGQDARSVTIVDPRSGASLIRGALRGQGLLAVGDVDGDGVDEVVAADAVLREAEGDALRMRGAMVGAAVAAIVRVDLDGDGLDELVAHAVDRGELVVHGLDDQGLHERSRTAAPGGLVGLRALAREDGHDVAWWTAEGFGALEGDGLAPLGEVALEEEIDDLLALHLDDDGRQDLVVVTRRFESVAGVYGDTSTLLLTQRVGDEWSPPTVVASGRAQRSVVAARLDEDALDDLWVVDAGGTWTLRSEADWQPIRVGAATEIAGATAADVDGDGRLDLVGCEPSGTGVLAARGLGDGAVDDGVRLSGAACSRVHACDGAARLVLERSRDLDGFAHVEVLHAGDGGWSSGGTMNTNLGATMVALRCEGDEMSLWTGGDLGVAAFEGAAGRALLEQGRTAPSTAVLLGDVDGDGFDDMIADDDPRVMLARGDGLGGFRIAQSLARPPGALPGRIVGVGEFDGDPGAELIASEVSERGVVTGAVWRLAGEGLVRAGTLPISRWDTIGDFDGDGRDELLSRADGEPALVRPGAPVQRVAAASFVGLGSVRAVDMDGDGRDDLLAEGEDPEIVLLRGEGDEFAAPRRLGISGTIGRLAVGDLDGDGALDLVVAGYEARTVCLGGAAGPASRCMDTPADGGSVRSMVLEDVDGDGNTDVIVVASSFEAGWSLQVQRGDGAGGLVETPAQGFVAGELRRARLGGDGPGLVVLGYGQGHVVVPEAKP